MLVGVLDTKADKADAKQYCDMISVANAATTQTAGAQLQQLEDID